MHVEHSLVDTSQGVFLFKVSEFNGIAGETCTAHQAWKIDTTKGKMKRVHYECLYEAYRKMKEGDRRTRISFWFAMKLLAPIGRKQELCD